MDSPPHYPPPVLTPDQHIDNSQSSEVIPSRKEEVCNDDTEIIINAVSDNWKPADYTGHVREAWGHIGHALGTSVNINDGNKWGQEMLDKCLVKSTKAVCWNLIYIMIILFSSVLFTAPAIIIPQNNSICFHH